MSRNLLVTLRNVIFHEVAGRGLALDIFRGPVKN